MAENDVEDFTQAELWELAAWIITEHLGDIDYLGVGEMTHDRLSKDPRYEAMTDAEKDELIRKTDGEVRGMAEELKKSLAWFVDEQKKNPADQGVADVAD